MSGGKEIKQAEVNATIKLTFKQPVFWVLLATVLTYGNTVFNGYAVDDGIVVSEHVIVQKGLPGIPELFRRNYIYLDNGQKFEYRPLAQVSFAIEYAAWGLRPGLSHAVNVLIYLILLWQIHLFLLRVLTDSDHKGRWAAAILMIYALHPAHTEVVASLKNREEMLSILFAVLCLRSFQTLGATPGRWQPKASVTIWFLLSLLCKMTAIYLPAIAIILAWHSGQLQTARVILWKWAILVTVLGGAFFIGVWSHSYRIILPQENPLISISDPFVRIGTSLQTLWFYIKFIVYPYPFRFYYGHETIPITGLGNFVVWMSLAVHLVLLVYGLRYTTRKFSAAMALCYLVSIVLYSNMILLYTGIVAERVLFFPSFFFIAGIVSFFFEFVLHGQRVSILRVVKPVGTTALLVIGLTSAAVCVNRNNQWKDSNTLMDADMDHLLTSGMANRIYARLLKRQAYQEEKPDKRIALGKKAIKHFSRSLTVTPPEPFDSYEIGLIYAYLLENYDSAYVYLTKAHQLDTTFMEPIQQIGKGYYLLGDLNKADSVFSWLYERTPNDSITLFFYPQVLMDLGFADRAFEMTERLGSLYPNLYYYYFTHGMLLWKSGRLDEAVEQFEIGHEKGGRDAAVRTNCEKYYLARGGFDKINELKRYYP